MPIVRTYACEQCNHFIRVTLTMEQADDPPPECPQCANATMSQEFYAPAIVGSTRSKATAVAADILEHDYNVANLSERGPGEEPKVRYRDQKSGPTSTWAGNREMLESALAIGRQARKDSGFSGLDVIKSMPDLIANSKKRSAKIW